MYWDAVVTAVGSLSKQSCKVTDCPMVVMSTRFIFFFRSKVFRDYHFIVVDGLRRRRESESFAFEKCHMCWLVGVASFASNSAKPFPLWQTSRQTSGLSSLRRPFVSVNAWRIYGLLLEPLKHCCRSFPRFFELRHNTLVGPRRLLYAIIWRWRPDVKRARVQGWRPSQWHRLRAQRQKHRTWLHQVTRCFWRRTRQQAAALRVTAPCALSLVYRFVLVSSSKPSLFGIQCDFIQFGREIHPLIPPIAAIFSNLSSVLIQTACQIVRISTSTTHFYVTIQFQLALHKRTPLSSPKKYATKGYSLVTNRPTNLLYFYFQTYFDDSILVN